EISKLSPRLQRMRMKLYRYDLDVTYKPGKELFIADALSRIKSEEDKECKLIDNFEVSTIDEAVDVSAITIEKIRNDMESDQTLNEVAKYVVEGWPNKINFLNNEVKQYYHLKDRLTVVDGILFMDNKIVIPKKQRNETLETLHESHLGMVKSKARAREVMFWPGINKDIEMMIKKCYICLKHRNEQQKEPMIITPLPRLPWSKVGVDLFELKGMHLICVDYYSKYPEVVTLSNTTAKSIILKLKGVFARFGIPEELVSDNGPQFTSEEFKEFMKSWNIKHTTSSPHYPQSNGQVERCIQTVKRLIKKATESGCDPHLALLEYRTTPLADIGFSPSQLLMNRRLRSKLPSTEEQLKPAIPQHMECKMNENKEKQCKYYNRGSKELQKLEYGMPVLFKKGGKWICGIISNVHNAPRSYWVKTEDGSSYRRNRKQILIDTSAEIFTRMSDKVNEKARKQIPSSDRVLRP
ncbi:uncharacterized protein B4U79_03400, partial [Dinothrombium tinctorium]